MLRLIALVSIFVNVAACNVFVDLGAEPKLKERTDDASPGDATSVDSGAPLDAETGQEAANLLFYRSTAPWLKLATLREDGTLTARGSVYPAPSWTHVTVLAPDLIFGFDAATGERQLAALTGSPDVPQLTLKEKVMLGTEWTSFARLGDELTDWGTVHVMLAYARETGAIRRTAYGATPDGEVTNLREKVYYPAAGVSQQFRGYDQLLGSPSVLLYGRDGRSLLLGFTADWEIPPTVVDYSETKVGADWDLVVPFRSSEWFFYRTSPPAVGAAALFESVSDGLSAERSWVPGSTPFPLPAANYTSVALCRRAQAALFYAHDAEIAVSASALDLFMPLQSFWIGKGWTHVLPL